MMPVDIGSVAAIVSSLKAASDMARTMVNMSGTANVQGKVIELQGLILSAQGGALAAQAEQSSMVQKIGDLESEIARNKEWEKEKLRYELKELRLDSYAYALKGNNRGSEPDHYLCPTCFNKNKKVILLGGITGSRYRKIKCPECDTEIFHSVGERAIGRVIPG